MKYTIYSSTGVAKAEFDANQSCVHSHKIMTENVASLQFTLPDFVSLDVNDYILIEGQRFVLNKAYKPDVISTVQYQYNIKMYGGESIASNAIFVDANYKPITAYYDTPAGQLATIVACINRTIGSNVYRVGSVASSDAIQVSYSLGCNCFEALNTLAKASKSEWWIDVDAINITKCEYGTPVTLGYGQGLLSLNKEIVDTDQFYTRLIPFGSSRNIVPSEYGHETLQLPGGDKYIDQNVSEYGIVEGFEQSAFSEIYPRYNGTVGVVRTENRTIDGKDIVVYFFKDTVIPFNPAANLLPGLVAHVVFKSGDLLYQDFEANWNNDVKEWELITQYPSATQQLPGGNVIPRTGDRYTIYNIKMDPAYYIAAEQEFLNAARDFLNERAIDYSNYKGPTDHVYLEENNISLKIGRRVRLLSTEYFPAGYRDSRIIRIVRKLSDLNDMDIEISSAVVKSTYGALRDNVSNLIIATEQLSGEIINIIKSYQIGDLTDNNVMSSLRVIKEIYRNALSRLSDDTAQGLITLLKGWRTGDWSQGSSGTSAYRDATGMWHLEADYIRARRKFTAEEVEIMRTSHIGGRLMQTAARMTCTRVEELANAYRCYFRREDGDGNFISNDFAVGDQAYLQTFNLVQHQNITGNRFFWRAVTAVGLDYIDLSKTNAAALSDVPIEGDEIVQLGYQGTDNAGRQGAIIQAGAGDGSPFIRLYSGINTFALPQPVIDLNTIQSIIQAAVKLLPGSTGAANLTDLPDVISDSVKVGGENLLRNTSFTGDFGFIDLFPDTQLNPPTEMYGTKLKYWEGNATINDDNDAKSLHSAVLGNISQGINLINGESYVIGYTAKNGIVTINVGGVSIAQSTTSSYARYTHKFTYDGSNNVISFGGSATICDIKLERGTIATDWSTNSLDTDPIADKFRALKYISDAMKQGSTDILGGLILSSVIMLGNYSNGVMQQVTAGMSGIYNNDNDVYTWGGGTLEQAMRTVSKYLNNPTYQPTEAELSQMAKAVITHGGRAIFNDVILRGYVYALGGIFQGAVKIANGKILLNEDGSGQLANGAIYWDADGVLFSKQFGRKIWRRIYDEISSTNPQNYYEIEFDKGTFIDITNPAYTDLRFIELPNPDRYKDVEIEMRVTYVGRVGSYVVRSQYGLYYIDRTGNLVQINGFSIQRDGDYTATVKSFYGKWIVEGSYTMEQ